jgi:hypothetical protein
MDAGQPLDAADTHALGQGRDDGDLLKALLDFDGLTELENHIKALKMILKPKNACPAKEGG